MITLTDLAKTLTDEEKEQMFLFLLTHINLHRVIYLISMNLHVEQIDTMVEKLGADYGTTV